MGVHPFCPACFNPHPPLLAGETSVCRNPDQHSDCFNPHPPLLAGETRLQALDRAQAVVSIHTRHYWRVKRFLPVQVVRTQSFNPHPPLLAGETTPRLWPGCSRVGFNPHPPLLAGETPCRGPPRRPRRCFNPHPPLLAGETFTGVACTVPVQVSIHTRHYWRVKPRGASAPKSRTRFQSTPAITGG